MFDAVVKPTVSYGSEIWGTLCSEGLSLELKDMQKLQLAFFRQVCRLRNSVSAPIVFAELAEAPWLRIWWSQVIGFMHRLAKMSSDSLHADILSDNINDALHGASSHNWASGIQKHYAHLGLASGGSLFGRQAAKH